MKLTNEWFTSLSENEDGLMIVVNGRTELEEFISSGKFKDRVEITYKYEGDDKGMPSEKFAEQLEAIEEAIRKTMERDKFAILTGVYTGGGEKTWVLYTRAIRAFDEYLNNALASFELLPISIYAEVDAEWEEYLDMLEMKEWSID